MLICHFGISIASVLSSEKAPFSPYLTPSVSLVCSSQGLIEMPPSLASSTAPDHKLNLASWHRSSAQASLLGAGPSFLFLWHCVPLGPQLAGAGVGWGVGCDLGADKLGSIEPTGVTYMPAAI